ncbi:MAG TPA: quinone-dependent dihydroorotate dehydrogenase [Caldithrix sp.]|nr:quinone-dependent dihydroorotate dehydrogenase [Caldithrix sp.]
MYKNLIRKILFRFDPEKVHRLVIFLLRLPLIDLILKLFYRLEHPALHREVFGLRFKNPVGLAAGFDKNAEVVSRLGAIGFGFIEIGTVTPRPQEGNPKPRIFRLVEDQALINRMGFNNDGAVAVAHRLQKRRGDFLVAGNIGKNKTTPNPEALRDYQYCFETLFEYVDFFVVNVSSPNTPGLRQLQEKEPLKQLLQHLQKLNKTKPQPKPILLKIAPDLNEEQLDEIIELVQELEIDGVVATNTTVGRENLKTDPQRVEEMGEGGLSGVPLRERSTEVIRYLHRQSKGAFPIIGVGGIHSPEDALEKLSAGASLVEIYTGFIYEGPGLLKRIKKQLIAQKEKDIRQEDSPIDKPE